MLLCTTSEESWLHGELVTRLLSGRFWYCFCYVYINVLPHYIVWQRCSLCVCVQVEEWVLGNVGCCYRVPMDYNEPE